MVSGRLRGDFDGPMLKLIRQILREDHKEVDQICTVSLELWQKLPYHFHREGFIVSPRICWDPEEWRAIVSVIHEIKGNARDIYLVSWSSRGNLLIVGELSRRKTPQCIMISS